MTKYRKVSTGAALITMAALIMGLLGPLPFAAKEAYACHCGDGHINQWWEECEEDSDCEEGGICVECICEEEPECTTDDDCDAMDNDYCEDAVIMHDEGVCVDFECEVETTPVLDCDDGLYCNGEETCSNANCVGGTPIDCSGYDLSEIATCTNNPDNNPFTWDFFIGFTSTCNECADICTTGTINLTHTCDIEVCGADCEKDSDCPDTICEDECIGNDYYDYDNVANTCLGDCTCTENPCGEPSITYNAPACTECQADDDCDELDEDYCDGTLIMHDEGVCNESFECEVETTPGPDCDDSLYCNGQEACSNASCVAGTPIDCSTYNLSSVETCGFDPDNNVFTWDFFAGFLSECDEETDSCTTGTETLTHACDIENCDAECEEDEDCGPSGICTACACGYEYEPYCGDEIINGEEECDDGPEGSETCTPECVIIEEGPYCGDGSVDEGEECDNNGQNGQACFPGCNDSCTYCSTECTIIELTGGGCGGGGDPEYPRLTINKSVAEEFTNPDTTINYAIVVKNVGKATAYNVLLADALPEGLTYKETGLSTRDWDLDNILRKSEKTVTYQVIVGKDVLAGDYINTATVKANNLSPVSDDATIEIRIPVVLGEMTELPDTGATPLMSILWVIAVITLISSTAALIKVVPKDINLSNRNKKSFGNLAY